MIMIKTYSISFYSKDISVLNEIKLFQTAIDQNNVSIALFNTNGDYIYVNKAYAQEQVTVYKNL